MSDRVPALLHEIRGHCAVISFVAYYFETDTSEDGQKQLLEMLSRNLAGSQLILDELNSIVLVDKRVHFQIKDDVVELLSVVSNIQSKLSEEVPEDVQSQCSYVSLLAEDLSTTDVSK